MKDYENTIITIAIFTQMADDSAAHLNKRG